jgi:hypothetical protein
MTAAIPFETLSDDDLHATVRRLTARSNLVLSDLLAHLGEVERRGVHRLRACASLYTYCVYELRMSEDAAFRRSKASRLVREYPEVFEMIAKGELHLTGLLMIGPHLGGERHSEILERARFRSKSEIARLIARIDPKPEVPARVEPIGPAPRGPATHAALVEALSGPVRHLPPGQRPEDWMEAGAEPELEPEPSTREPAPEPERPLRYKVQFTASQEYVDLMSEAFDLLGHEMRKPDLVEVQLQALRELVKQLRRRKRAATERPPSSATERPPSSDATRDAAPERESAADSPGRHVPAAVQRAVWARGGEQCVYVDGRGCRCRETRGLELHHRVAHALGGTPTIANLEVRCRAHNTLAAEGDFGREHMNRARGAP